MPTNGGPPNHSSQLLSTQSGHVQLNYETALRDCAAGRQAGVARIYVTEGPKLRAYVRRIISNREHAEDVLHDTFAQILRDAKAFDPSRGSARAWIYAILRNTALKSRERAGRELAVGEQQLHSICDRQNPEGDLASNIADSACVRSCLEEMEPRRRASLILAIIDGRTHAEIADYLGVPVGTVKAWIRRELIALRERLK
jgi:RNA polymerase sigma-70 factor (ECF subfamily)